MPDQLIASGGETPRSYARYEFHNYYGSQLQRQLCNNLPGLPSSNRLITHWVKNEKLILKMISGAPLKAYKQRWMLEPTKNGSIFTFMKEIVMPFGVFGKLLEKVGRGSSEAFIRVMLAKLKELAES